jgi:hypothetical protein
MKKFFARINVVFRSFCRANGWRELKQSDLLILRHDADCGYRYANAVYSPIADTLVEHCLSAGFTVQSVATPFSHITKQRAFNYPVAFNRPFLAIALWARVLKLLIGPEKSKAWASTKKTNLWLNILARVKPQMVIGIQPDISLCRAGRVLGVPVYDIQHGVIESSNSWYGEILERNSEDAELPSGFLCWDHESAKVLEAWAPARGAEVLVVGHPWYQRFRNPSANDGLVREALQSSRIAVGDKPTILVALQWGLHIHYYADTDFNHVMCDALESVILQTQGQYQWLLRLHPLQLTGAEGDHCEKYLAATFGHLADVEWYKTSTVPLPLLLSQVDLHITDMSSVVIEASWFGIPSALLNPFLEEGGCIEKLYLRERQSGIAKIIPQQNAAITSWIAEALQTKFQSTEKELPHSGVNSFLDRRLVKNV